MSVHMFTELLCIYISEESNSHINKRLFSVNCKLYTLNHHKALLNVDGLKVLRMINACNDGMFAPTRVGS